MSGYAKKRTPLIIDGPTGECCDLSLEVRIEDKEDEGGRRTGGDFNVHIRSMCFR